MNLEELDDLKRALAAKPPRIVRATALVLTALLASGAVWSAGSTVETVVKAPVRVRPVT
jgi:hypothetical protein